MNINKSGFILRTKHLLQIGLIENKNLQLDRIMFSVDYPYSPTKAGKKFLDEMKCSAEDKEKIAHGTRINC